MAMHVETSPERHARYGWARRLSAGRRVLDAGCGAGFGTALLAMDAVEAVGVDVSPAAVADAQREHGDRADFRQGDLRQLPFEDGEFDLVVCFEAISQVAEPEPALDELRRVLRPGGLLLISSPNRGVYPNGNPLHLSELTTSELEAALARRFSNVAMLGQQTYHASLLATAATLQAAGPDTSVAAEVLKTVGGRPGAELYAIAAASDGDLPAPPTWIALGDTLDFEEQRERAESWQRRCIQAEAESMALRLEVDHMRARSEVATEPPDATPDDPLIQCELPLGRPDLVAHNEIVLSGWAASTKGIAGVVAQIGDRQWNATYGLDTPSVAKRLPAVEGADRAGYRLAIDTSSWEPGTQVVTVAAFDRAGGRSAVKGTIDIRPFAATIGPPPDDHAASEREDVAFSLEAPAIEDGVAEVEGALEVRGWAHAEDGVDAVVVTIDGAIQYDALRPLARPDLLADHGPDVAADAGFALRIDPVDCPPGRHRLTVAALGRGGGTAGVECALRCRVPASPAASVANAPSRAGGTSPPRLRPARDATDPNAMWESRALLAESDAALCRAQARFALTSEERARRELRDAERRQREAQERFADRLAQLDVLVERERHRADEAVARVAAQEDSASWRLTRPLRAAKRALFSRAR